MSKRTTKRLPNKQHIRRRRAERVVSSTCEALEMRVLLAGDTFSAWQNPINPHDINQDNHVTPADVLVVRQVLNIEGSHALPPRAAGEPGSASPERMMLDANGDGHVSAIDALRVVQALNAQGEGEEFQFRVDVHEIESDNSTGNIIDEVHVGDTFRLNVYVQDLRGVDAFGVFSAYVDITYDASLISVAQGAGVVHAAPFDDGVFGDLSVPGLIDDAGGFDQSGTGDGSEQLLFQIDLVADNAGVVTFQSDPADTLPLREFLSHESINPIDPSNIVFGAASLTVVDDQSAADLAGFAKALADAGVEFWSTHQFNTDAVDQRAVFEDAASFLPLMETLDDDGEINTAATAQNVTEVNTWIFPDETRATGVLSLADISSRSGVAIPTPTGPTIKQVVANDAIDLEFGSPLNLGIDTYDATNGPITYTVTVDNPGLVESTVITGNRGWELDIQGYGPMVFEFFEGRAPRATDQFIGLTEDGFYDGLTFHRILDDFVIQGGDPLGTGTGGSDLPDFLDQFHVDLQHNQVGVLSMAKSADDTNNSQFFVTDDTTRHLDFNHTIFGQLIEGFEVLDAVSAVDIQAPVSQGRPVVPVVINTAKVIDDQENGVVMLRALASSGTTNVTITATDSLGNTDTNTFEVNLVPDAEDGQPFLRDIPNFVAQSDTDFTFQLEAVDVEGDPVQYDVNFTSPAGVTATVSEQGLVTVNIPDSVSPGEEVMVRVRTYDNFPNFPQSPRDEQVVTILIDDDVSENIVAEADAFTIDEDSGTHTFSVLDNDEGNNVTISSVTTPADGATVEITNDGKINYTPAPNFPLNSTIAQDSVFSYTIVSADGETFSVGTVTVTVNPVNDPPTANDDAFPADFNSNHAGGIVNLREDATEDTLLFLMQNDAVSPDEEIPAITSAESDSGAALQIVNLNSSVNYRAAANVFGTDTFTYTLTDPGGLSDTATVTVEIAQVNDAPETADDTLDVLAGRETTIAAADLLDNDTAGPLEDAIQTLSIASVTQPANGTVTLNADGSLTYTANAGFSGPDSFEYTVTDDGITEDFDSNSGQFVASADPLTATGTVTVNAAVAEIAVDDTFSVDGGLTTVSLDVRSNDDLTLSPIITAVTDPSHGTVEIINDGNDVSYTRDANFTGTDSFTYTLTDTDGNMSTATVTLNVRAPNTPPTALDDAFTVPSDNTAHRLDVLANDTVQDGETATVFLILDSPDNGQISISNIGDAILYTPDVGFSGTDTLIYQVHDGSGGFDSAQVTITVETTNTDPVAVDDAFKVAGDVQRSLDVLQNDTTEAGETLLIDAIVTPPTNGVATISGDGTQILYERIDDVVTSDTLVYRISDGNGGFDTATVNITIVADNEAPIANDDAFTINDPGEQSLDVLANDTTEAGETLVVDAITVAPTLGTAVITSDGSSILFTPNAGAMGTDTLTYQVNDGNGGIDTAVVTLTLDVANQDPVANDDTVSLVPVSQQTIQVLDNDQTEPGETLTITATGGNPTGTIAINGDGTAILYTPAIEAAGTTDTFTYMISDGNGGTAEATVTVDIEDFTSSFFAGMVFQDINDDGQHDEGERGIGGVTLILEGTDIANESVRMETRTALDGSYRFEGIAPGDYTITQVQPEFLNSGTNTLGLTVTEEDTFDFQVSEELIASEDNMFAESGLPVRFAMLDALTSARNPGVFVVLHGDELAWMESRGGWEDVDSLMLSRDGNDLVLESSEGNGVLSMSQRGIVQLIGQSGEYTMLRINGTSEDVLSAAAVDAVMAG